MSNLYGTMLSDVSKVKTSQGNTEMTCRINAWDVGVKLHVYRDENNRLHITVSQTKGSNNTNVVATILYKDIIP